MEYVKLGPLVSDREKFAFSESDIKEITIQVLKGLSIMHKHKYAHRDIKPDVRRLNARS